MNNVYKELALQARNQCIEEFSGSTSKSTAWSWEENFARLIIQECVKVAEQAESYRYGGLASKNIEEHFGTK